MNKAELTRGIDLLIDGLTIIKKNLDFTPDTSADVTAPKLPANGKFDPEQLNAMPYNEFKKFAAELGVKCTGSREDIMKRVMALDVTVTKDAAEVSDPAPEDAAEKPKKTRRMKNDTATEPDETEKEDEKPAPQKSDKSVGGKRGLVKKAAVPATDEFDEQAKAILDDTPVEEVLSALAEVEVKATKKNVAEKLAYALREGLIEPDSDEDEGDEETETTDAPATDDEDGEEVDAKSYFSEYDPDGFNKPDTMTDERRDAVETKMDEILTAVSEEKLTTDDIQTWLEGNATQDELDLLGDDPDEDEMLKLYMEIQKRLIDNEGEEHENSDPYELGEDNFCCGHKLKYQKKTKKYVCEICGEEYEAE